MKPLELLLPRNIINQKQYFIPGSISEISATIKDLKNAGVVIPTTSLFYLPVWSRRQISLGDWQWIIISISK